MIASFLFTLLLLGVSKGNAQKVYNTEQQIYENDIGSPVISVAAVGGPAACAPAFIALRRDNARCAAILSNDTYAVTLESCPPELVGATALSCVASACYALNPSQKTIVVLDNYITLVTFRVTTTISISGLANPTIFSAYQRGNTTVELLVVDASGNSVWRYNISTTSPMTTTNIPAPFTGTPIGIFTNTPTTFIVATNGSTQISAFPLFGSGGAVPFGPTFGDIRSISLDGFGNVHVYDATCGCIQVVNPSGSITTNVSTNLPIFVSHSRKKILVVEVAGVTKFEDALTVKISSTPVTCAGRNGSVTVQVSGGDYPYKIGLFPDYRYGTLNTPGDFTFFVNAPSVPGFPVTLLDEVAARYLLITSTIVLDPVRRGWTNATAHTGLLSYYWNFTMPYDAMVFATSGNPAGSINGDKYEYFEFWINIGDGGQRFNIDINFYTINVVPGDLPLNTWVQYKFLIPRLLLLIPVRNTLGYFSRIQFSNQLNDGQPQNYIYFDSFTATPYTSTVPDRNVYVFDKCYGVTHSVVPFIYKPLEVYVTTKEVSCNAASTTSAELTRDGAMTANVVNGVGPFAYNWSYPINSTYSNSSSVIYSNESSSTIRGFATQTSFISVYENALNSTWVDTSTAVVYSLSDTRYFRSPPNSIAFTPLDDGQAIIFSVPRDVSPIDFPIVEFWVNGGPTGGQTLAVWTYNSASSKSTIIAWGGPVTGYTYSSYMSPPPNTWIKVSYEISPTADKYNVIAIVNSFPSTLNNNPPAPINQSTIWIDDLILVGKKVVSVTDITGCTASTAKMRIETPPPLKQSVSVSNVKCYGNSDGSVVVQMSGGVQPYSYNWSNAIETDSIRSNLPEGNVSVGVRDAKRCQFKEFVATLLQPPGLQLTTTIAPPKCYNGHGRVTATTTGGTGLYTYSWSSPTVYPQVILQPAPEPVFMDSPTSPFALFNAQAVCKGTGFNITGYSPSHSGYCAMNLNFGANSPYSGIVGCSNCLDPSKHTSVMFFVYVDSLSTLSNLAVGFSQGGILNSSLVNISSLGAVPKVWSQVTVQLNSLAAYDGILFVSSSPNNMGVVIVDDIVVIPNIPNGAGFSTYPGFISELDAVAAQYFIMVVDSNGCGVSSTVNVTQPAALRISANSTAPTSPNGKEGSITVQATGGTGPYQYLWVGTQEEGPKIYGLSTGTYKIVVIDANGCTYNTTLIVDPFIEGPTIREYSPSLAGGVGVIAAVGLIIALFSFFMLVLYWDSFSEPGRFFSSVVLLGCFLAFISALLLLPRPTDSLCAAFPWLLGVGFVLVYGCLFIKTWALFQVWTNAIPYSMSTLSPAYITKVLGVAMIGEVIFLSVWTAVEPPKAYLVNVINNSQEWQCDVEHSTFWVIFLVAKVFWLIFGSVLSILTRNVVKEYNESPSYAYAIYNNLVLATIVIPLVILLKETPGGRIVVEVVVITTAFSFTLVVISFKNWHHILTHLPGMKTTSSRRSLQSPSEDYSNSM